MNRTVEKEDEVLNIFNSEVQKYINSIHCSMCLGRLKRVSTSQNG